MELTVRGEEPIGSLNEYCPTNHTLLKGILPLSLVEQVVELTVPEEEPIGSLMRIVRPITGLVWGLSIYMTYSAFIRNMPIR